MYIQSEGIILRQVKALGGRRMITVFSKNYGKISCGTSITEGGKNKTALALRPFTYGKYELYQSHGSYNLRGAETIKSFYSLGEDVDKYMAASYVLELTDKVLIDEDPQPSLFKMMTEFFEMLENRKKAYGTLVIGYQTKLLSVLGLKASEGLKTEADADIIETLRFIESHNLKELETLALKPETENRIRTIFKAYFAYHLGVENLKSEGLNL